MAGSASTNVIVAYNNREDLPALLDDLRQHAPSSPTIVVDNASSDGTADLIAAQFPRVHLVRNPANAGYARAVNQGIALCTTPHVFLLNPDIRISTASLFRDLSAALMAEPCIAVTGPLQFKQLPRGPHLNFTWSYWTPRAFILYMRHLLGRGLASSQPVRVSFLNAGCLYLRRSAFHAVGGLNERYFLYGEEPDLFLKFTRFGFQCRLVPAASVLHARERSLRSVPWLKRLGFRLLAVRNIVDAVLRGLAALLIDRISGRRPAAFCRE